MNRSLCWIRRDLRLHDHYALSEALKNASECFIVFIFDTQILKNLHNKSDPRIIFILDSLFEIENELQKRGGSLLIRHGDPVDEIENIIHEYNIDGLFFNRDYEPYAKKRDQDVITRIKKLNKQVFTYKDHVFYESSEIKNGTNETYKVFTPYKNKWLEKFHHECLSIIPSYNCSFKNLAKFENNSNILNLPWLLKIGFKDIYCSVTGGTKEAKRKINLFANIIAHYKEARDFPALEQTSNISPYIRFGNLSIRDMIRLSIKEKSIGNEIWLSELIWRDFYHTILDIYPYVEKKSFKLDYDRIKWPGKKDHFIKWCEGNTGFPIIDSAMRCLNQTGLMHNRLRMVVASFLTKTLLIDYKWGEEYFANKLLDFDLAANNGGWQWTASTGVDAQPYFRIFNPYNQSKKFDPKGIFIKKWCPELRECNEDEIHSPSPFSALKYPAPIVNYKLQRERAILMYKNI